MESRADRKLEALFAEFKNQIGLRRLRLRRLKLCGNSSSRRPQHRTSSVWCGSFSQPTRPVLEATCLKELRGRKTQQHMPRKKPFLCDSFSTPTPANVNWESTSSQGVPRCGHRRSTKSYSRRRVSAGSIRAARRAGRATASNAGPISTNAELSKTDSD